MREMWQSQKSMVTGCGARNNHQSNMKWARQYVPQDRPFGFSLSFNRPPGRSNWVGRYVRDRGTPLNYDKNELNQVSFSRTFGRTNHKGEVLSEHQACSRVLKWLWDKHAETSKLLGQPLPEVMMPEHVRRLLLSCHDCENGKACQFFQDVVKKDEEGSGSNPEDSVGDTSGLGSDDSGLSDTSSDKMKAGKNKKRRQRERRKATLGARTKRLRAACRRRRIWGSPRPRRIPRQAARPAQ